MYEHMTYEYFMKRVLARVPNDKDKRQGSVIWDALAPACAEFAQMCVEFDNILKITFAETSFGEWLDKRCSEMGVHREPSTAAVRLGLFYTGGSQNRQPFDVPIGSIYSLETLNYKVIARLDTGKYEMSCEDTGTVGNRLFGRLTPVESIKGLSYAELTDVLIPGEDVETDASLYLRYDEAVNTTPFGGNIADYKRKVKAIEGVGDCKVFPVRRGGGTVDVTLISTEWEPPSQVLIDDVQEKLDPEPFHQMGMGLAPVGHYVIVYGVESVTINIKSTLILKSGTTLGQVENEIYDSVKDYLLNLTTGWASEDNLIIRVSQIESRILNIPGILDVSGTTLNSSAGNITLGAEQIPMLGEVMLVVG